MENALLIEYIEETCKHRADVTAIVDEHNNDKITYKELAEKYSIISRQIIRRINYDRHKDTPPLIAVIANRNIASIISALAVLHAQCVFIPIDPDLPEICHIQILQHSKCQLLLVDDENMVRVRTYPLSVIPPIIVLDRRGNLKDLTPSETFRFTAFPVRKEPLMYVLYKNDEEGGKAQGVMATNQGIVNVLRYFITYMRLKDYDRFISLMPLACDASIVEIFCPLLMGATLFLASPATTEDPVRLMKVLEEQKITFLQGTIRLFEALLDYDWQGDLQLQIVIAVGGGNAMYHQPTPPTSPMKKALLASTSGKSQKETSTSPNNHLLEELKLPSRFYGLVKKCRQVYSVYGSSETSIWSSCHWLEGEQEPLYPDTLIKSLIPSNYPITAYYIGQPIHHVQFYLLNKKLQDVKPGQLGELYIGGKTIAKGYLHDSHLTRSKFIKHPTIQKKGKLYKTGLCCIKLRNPETSQWDYLVINGIHPEIALQEGVIAMTKEWYRTMTQDLSSWTSTLFNAPLSPIKPPFSWTASKPVVPVNDNGDLPKANISSFTSVTTQGTDQSNQSKVSTTAQIAPEQSLPNVSTPIKEESQPLPSQSNGKPTTPPLTRNRRRSSVLKKTLIIPAGHFYQYSSSALAQQEEEEELQRLQQQQRDDPNNTLLSGNGSEKRYKTVQISDQIHEQSDPNEEEDDDDEDDDEEEEEETHQRLEGEIADDDEQIPTLEKTPSFKRQRQSTFVYTPSPYARSNSIRATPTSTIASPDSISHPINS